MSILFIINFPLVFFFPVDNRKCLFHGSTSSVSYFCRTGLSYSIGFATGFLIDMLTHRGFSAWVMSNGKVLAEHLVAVDERSHRVSCWIPGTEGHVRSSLITFKWLK